MTEHCKNCGAELFTGQQFCRVCGTPVSDERPTQILQPNQQSGTPAETSRLSPVDTDPIFPPPGTAYQSSFASAQQQQHRPFNSSAAARRSGSRRGWIVAFMVLGVLGVSVFAALMFAISARRANDKIVRIKRPKIVKPVPPSAVMPPPPQPAGVDGDIPGEEDAEVSGDETSITKSYPLSNNAKVSIKNIRGAITVEGWDEPRAEVRIIKHGSEEGRNSVLILASNEGNQLSLRTPEAAQGLLERVEYEIKVPRNVREIEISARESEVRVSNVSETVSVDVLSGSIELTDVSGTAHTKIIKGDTEVVFADAARKGAQEFTSVRGNIEIHVRPETNADLKVETVAGDIDIEDDIDIKVEKRIVGRHAAGRLGTGGAPLVVKTVNGDIKLSR